jgi:predicted nucleic acid-binding protein
MIVLETSILVLAFGLKPYRRKLPPEVADLRQLIADDWPLAIPGVVLQELLAGVQDEGQFERLRRVLAAYPSLNATRESHVNAAKISLACRRVGARCSAVECLIAALATESESLLFTMDRNFSKIAPQCGLRLYEAGMIARMPKPN